MLTLITGMPGAGKTAAMVDILRKLAGTRPLYVHFDPESKKRADQVLLHESLLLDHQPCHANKWHEQVPDGGVLVIDEVQDVWRPRGPGSKVPEAIQALETHRHGGIDIFITTQNPRLVDANVRGLVGRHVHIRDTGWLGRQWYEWPECNEAMAWKTCPVKMKYKVPKEAMGLYKSANEHTKPIRKTPPALYLAIAAIVAACIGGVMVVRTVSKGGSSKEPAKEVKADVPGATGSGGLLSSVGQGHQGGQRLIDDRIDWIPRVSSRPESAPAYDEIRKVSAMPIVVGCMQFKGKTRCFTQQGTDAGIEDREAQQLMQDRRFDAYTPEIRRDISMTNADRYQQRDEQRPGLVYIEGPGHYDPKGIQATAQISRSEK